MTCPCPAWFPVAAFCTVAVCVSASAPLDHVEVIRIGADFGAGEQQTDRSIRERAIVRLVCVDVQTADPGKTLHVGTPADPDGFVSSLDVGAVGLACGSLATSTLGELLSEASGTALVPAPDTTSGGAAITFTGSSTANTTRGLIYVFFEDLH